MTIDEIRKAQADGFRFAVGTYPGVAFYFKEAQLEWRQEYDDELNVYDMSQESGMVYMIMVGDDYRHLIDPMDIELVADYCRECGQIGCTHDGVDRDG